MTKTIPFKVIEIQNHGKSKYQIIHINGKHIAYINSKQEAETLLRYLNHD